ncbi:Ku DNA-binding complex, Ku70 subunit [Auriscalpium vulgare]|uniref:Ku DNA-binding complex, Ku70 subunit n=1 Tax=Auriscalpium vulgare TaxID=40419 RepID=A0ACB8S2Z9_9AGAM|nr:Ku DNA-binding complex, Ku70 subunit [Auriscalpium vulgare]
MAPYDDWNKLDEDEEDELLDPTYYERKRDVILFCIDCSESMLELRDDPNYEDAKTSRLLTALDAAVQIQKKKVVVGPNDAVGILLYNTTRRNETGTGSEIKKGTYAHQAISTISAPTILDLIQLVDEAREKPELLTETFPPMTDSHVPIGDVFTSCNWVLRDGAPKTASKRVFLITDDDNPSRGAASGRLVTSARTTLIDLVQAGVTVEPFFISDEDKPFDQQKFWANVLLPDSIDADIESDPSVLPESISITRIDDLLDQMRFHEVPKRALFSIPFELAEGFVIGVKGYGLVTEQKKGSYRYFVDYGESMEVAESKTEYVDETRESAVDNTTILFGMTLGATADDEDSEQHGFGARTVPTANRVFYTAEEVKTFRSFGLQPRIKLLGFKDRDELAFEDNVKHSTFIHPDELSYSGSKRTFSALLKTMVKKNKFGLVLGVTRSNATPTFFAMLPQSEKFEDGGWSEPAGFHLIPLPFADDIRSAPIEEAFRASKELVDAMKPVISKLALKNGTYPPDSYPNPALAFHNAQLEASAFREEYDPEAFEDLTVPKYSHIHKKAGPLIKEFLKKLREDESAKAVIAEVGSKRKADVQVDEAEIRSKYDAGNLEKLRVDQLKEFLKGKGLAHSGKKADLVERVNDYLLSH